MSIVELVKEEHFVYGEAMNIKENTKENLSRISVQLSEADRLKFIAIKGYLQQQRRPVKGFVLDAIWEKAEREYGKRT